MDIITEIAFIGLLLSIFPTISLCIMNNPDNDGMFQSIFKRLDSSTYFTDAIIIELREKYTAKFKRSVRLVLLFIFSMTFAFVFAHYDESLLGISKEQSEVIASFVAVIYVIGSITVFGGLGLSESRLAATKPLSTYQRNEMERIILESDCSDSLIAFMNLNPKNKLAYIDVLNLKFQADRLKSQYELKKRNGKLSDLIK